MSFHGQALARAQAYEHAGEFAQAERIYEQILRGDPLLAVAWHRLGLVHFRLGRIERAAESLGRAVSLDSSNATFHCDLGTIYRQLGRIDDAIDSFQQAVQLASGDAQVQYHLGTALQQRHDQVGAKLRFQQAVRLQPEFAEAWNDLGIAHQWLGELDESSECFQRLIALVPGMSGAHFNLGNVRLAQGRLLEAIACYARALEQQPPFVEALNNLGTALHKLGRVEQARHAYETALKLRPGFADARNNLGALLNLLGRSAQAEACYREALAVDPRSVAAINNLAGVLQSQLRLDEAKRLLRQALELDPYAADAPGNLANVLALQGRMDEAAEYYRRAVEIVPHPRLRIHAATMLPPIYQSVQEMQHRREALESNLAQLLESGVGLDPHREPVPVNFLLAYQGFNDCELARRVAELYRVPGHSPADSFPGPAWERRATQALPAVHVGKYDGPPGDTDARQSLERSAFPGRAWERGNAAKIPVPHFAVEPAKRHDSMNDTGAAHPVQNALPGKIRIGFLSKFLRDHTIGDLLKGLIRNLSRSDFEVTVFLVGDAVDETVKFLQDSADRFISLPEDVVSARRIIADASLDVLFYPDVGMDPVSSALAFSRLARVQCTTWGHPVTTGIPTIDYFLSSKLIEPAGANAHYTEQLVLLDSLPTFYYRPQVIAAGRQPGNGISPQREEAGSPLKKGDRHLAATDFPGDCYVQLRASPLFQQAARREFGLPQDAHVYLCPQSLFKFHPDFDTLLGAILARDSAARIVLIEAPHAHWTEMLSHRLRRNLNELSRQVTFVPRIDRAAFLRLLTTADVVLDPLHFGGGNTSFQALGLGLPIVTLPSEFMRGRLTAGCYRKMEYETCVARDADEYVDLAVRLGTDPAFNALVRSQIASRSAVLFEDMAAVRELEEFFKMATRTSHVAATRSPQPATA